MKFIFPFLFIATTALSQENSTNNSLLWEITYPGNKHVSYLFGTYHTNDKRVFNWSDSTYYALNVSEAVALETDIYGMFRDWDTRIDGLTLNFDNKGNAYTTSKKPTTTAYGNENGMPQFLDLGILQTALIANKDFYALESIEDQINLIDNSENRIYFPYSEKYFPIENKALNIYLSGDIELIERSLRTSLRYNPAFFKKLIIDRNIVMANGIDTLAKERNLFIAVGAGHLGGERGIINLLRSKGFEVRRVEQTYSKEPTNEKYSILSYKEFHFSDSTSKLHAYLPGKPVELENENVHLTLLFREMGQGNTYSIEVIQKTPELTIESVAMDYILNPGDGKTENGTLDDGTNYIQGISDSYPEGIAWVRVIESDEFFAILKTYGGNKFMNSKRPFAFFNKVWFEEY